MATFWGKNKFIDKTTEAKFNPDYKIKKLMWLDRKNGLLGIAVKDGMKPNFIFELSELKGYKIFTNQKEVSGKSGIGRAVGGGLLFGPTGAIVGGITGKKNAETFINQLMLNLEINANGKTACEGIPLILMRKININSSEYRDIESTLSEMVELLDSLLTPISTTNDNDITLKQQLLDLKELLDLDLINQQEFDLEKSKLLNK